MKKLVAISMLLAPFAANAVKGVEIAGVTFPTSIQLSAEGSPLHLNGAGVRGSFWRKVNIVVLYLPEPATSWEQLIAQRGEKRVVVHMLHPQFTAEQFRVSWSERFSTTLSVGERTTSAPRIETFLNLFETVRQGDELWFDCIPGTGLRLSIRQEVKGTIPGEDFCYVAYGGWLGPTPAVPRLKQDLLRGFTVERK